MRLFVLSVSIFMGGKCTSTRVTLFYHDKTEYQLFLRNVSASVTSYSFMAMTAVEIASPGLLLLQRNNGSGGFSGGGLNITTRVSKNIMDAYTHPNWYPLGYISECPNFQSFFFFTVPWM
jgi:hypothetical protein